ncbi:MAG: hypothetical protein NZ602_13505 [Thermoguttaceae bacterium]|nr:hypothetical protein [Thermoguttaceae bacterium]MDW8038179.1 hypothetical protein [Thermoguttaceae bacterium]
MLDVWEDKKQWVFAPFRRSVALWGQRAQEETIGLCHLAAGYL